MKVIEKSQILLLLFLALSSLVVLKPVKHILAFNMTKSPKHPGDLLNLLRRGGSYPLIIKALKQVDLLFRGVPSRPIRPRIRCHHVHAVNILH